MFRSQGEREDARVDANQTASANANAIWLSLKANINLYGR